MSYSNVVEIGWLNDQPDKLFVVDVDNFSLYQVDQSFKSAQYDCRAVSSTALTTKQDYEHLRCVALDHSQKNYLALGFNTGKINITKVEMDPSIKTFRGEELREVQKKSIACMAWSFADVGRLSAAYERGRGVEHIVVVYDVQHSNALRPGAAQISLFEANLSEKVSGISWFREDPSLLVVSTPRCLRLADVRERNGFHTSAAFQCTLLGVCAEPYDGYRIACHSRNTVYVLDRRFITFPIHEVAVDDSHTINRLIWQRTQPYQMTCTVRETAILYDFHISPNAFKNNNLAVVEKHGATLETIKQTFEAMSSENKYTLVCNSIPGYNRIFSFDWHPIYKHRLAVLSSSKDSSKQLKIIQQRNDVGAAISADGEMAFTAAGELDIICRVAPQFKETRQETGTVAARFAELSALFAEPDQASIMRQRIYNGYGYGNTSNALFTIIERSRMAIESDPVANHDIRFCWRWIDHMFQLSEINDFVKFFSTHFPGIKHVSAEMKSNSSIRNDEITYRNRIFTNEKRDRILKICGWAPFEDHMACKAMLDEMMAQKCIYAKIRAAALALIAVQGLICKQYMQDICKFTLSDEFKEAHEPDFVERYQKMVHSVTEVLNAFNGIRIPEYDLVCRDINDSYLLVILKYLARREAYNTIQAEIITLKDVELEDKLAFAAIHMDDESLNVALDKLLAELVVEQRPLSGLLITGLDDQTDCHGLIHKYIDLSRDIQTASILLIIGNCFRKSKLLQDMSLSGMKITDILTRAFEVEPVINARRRSLHCVRDYIELMGHWSFWLQKTFLASFLRNKPTKMTIGEESLRHKASVSAQAVIACNFCGLPIYPTMVEKIEGLRFTTSAPKFPRRGEKSRVIACSRCRKPLPKCVICRRHFGSQAEAISTGNDAFPIVTSAIDHWFAWCSSCNHGGHLSHIREWFNEYAVCPASGCDCLCMDRDHQLRDEIFVHSKKIGESLFQKQANNIESDPSMMKPTTAHRSQKFS